MSLFEQLIPKQILDLMALDQFDLTIVLDGTAANSKHPMARVSVNDVVINDGPVEGQKTINFSTRFAADTETVTVKIEHYDKDDLVTARDSQGNILENQSVTLTSILVNGVDIIKTGIIYNLGHYYQNLSEDKKEYFLANNIDIGPTHSLSMHENGHWLLEFKLPAMTNLIKFVSRYEEHEKWPNADLMDQYYHRIKRLENTNDPANK